MMPGRNLLYLPNYGENKQTKNAHNTKTQIFPEFSYFLWKILPKLKEERNQNWNKSDLLSSKEIFVQVPLMTYNMAFCSKEQLERINEIFHSNGTVSYDTKKLWYFLEDESVSLESQVNTVDVPTLAAAEFARGNWFQVKMNVRNNCQLIELNITQNMDEHRTYSTNCSQLDSWTEDSTIT